MSEVLQDVKETLTEFFRNSKNWPALLIGFVLIIVGINMLPPIFYVAPVLAFIIYAVWRVRDYVTL